MLQGNWEQYGDQENSFRLNMGARGGSQDQKGNHQGQESSGTRFPSASLHLDDLFSNQMKMDSRSSIRQKQ